MQVLVTIMLCVFWAAVSPGGSSRVLLSLAGRFRAPPRAPFPSPRAAALCLAIPIQDNYLQSKFVVVWSSMVGSRKDYFAPSSQIRINGITVFDFCSESSILLHIQACSPALHKKAKVDLLLHLHFAVFNYSAVIMTEKLLKLYISAGSIRYLTNIPEPMTYLMSFHVAETH